MTVSLGSCPDSHFLHIFLIREFRLDCRGAVEKCLSSFNGIQEIGNDPRLSWLTFTIGMVISAISDSLNQIDVCMNEAWVPWEFNLGIFPFSLSSNKIKCEPKAYPWMGSLSRWSWEWSSLRWWCTNERYVVTNSREKRFADVGRGMSLQ